MADKRITDVDFLESLDSDESFFVNQNNSIKQINKSNIVFGISNGGTGSTTVSGARNALGLGNTDGALPVANGGTGAVTADAARSALGAIAMTNTTATLTVSGWSDKKQTVNIAEVPSDGYDNLVIISPVVDSRTIYSECNIACTSQSNGTLTFECEDVPKIDIIVNVAILK